MGRPPKDKEQTQATEDNKDKLDSSKETLGTLLKANKDEHFNFKERVNWKVSTGSLILDEKTGGVMPSLWRFCAKSNAGKTPQMLEIVRNIFKDVPNSKCLWVIAEGRGLSEENKERCGLKFVYDYKDWEVNTIFVFETNVFELVIDTIKQLVLTNPDNVRYAFCIDSMDGLTLRADREKGIEGDNKVAGAPALSKKMMQSLSLGMFKYGHWMGAISQKTTEIKIDQRSPGADRGGNFSGGNSLFHASDVVLEYQQSWAGDFILDNPAGKMGDDKGTKAIGQNVRVFMAKSPKEASKKEPFTYPVKYGRKPSGIWAEREVVQMTFAFENATMAGAGWITFKPYFIEELKNINITLPEKIQGENNFCKMLEENPDMNKYLFNKYSKMVS